MCVSAVPAFINTFIRKQRPTNKNNKNNRELYSLPARVSREKSTSCPMGDYILAISVIATLYTYIYDVRHIAQQRPAPYIPGRSFLIRLVRFSYFPLGTTFRNGLYIYSVLRTVRNVKSSIPLCVVPSLSGKFSFVSFFQPLKVASQRVSFARWQQAVYCIRLRFSGMLTLIHQKC